MTDWEKRARAEDMFPTLSRDQNVIGSVDVWRDRALRLGREMADARAEEIAKAIERWPSYLPTQDFASLARSFTSKPKTREAALEDAVVQLRKLSISDIQHDLTLVERITRRALEWQPTESGT